MLKPICKRSPLLLVTLLSNKLLLSYVFMGASLIAQLVKNLPAMQETLV